jgi:peptide/nickel transport system substrate-binding protein
MLYKSSLHSAKVLIAAGALTFGIMAGSAHAGGKLVWALGADPDSLDPTKTTTWESAVIWTLIYDTLAAYDESGKAVPNLAKSWDVSADGLNYTFHLREGIKCGDGTPLDATDVKYSMDRDLDPKGGSVMKGAFGPITSVDVIDPLTVKFTLDKPFAAFVGFQAGPMASILCKGNKDLGDAFGSTKAIGSGPFTVTDWVKGDHMTLVPNPHYVNYGRPAENKGPPKFDQLIIRHMPEAQARLAALDTGEVGIAAPPLESVDTINKSSKLKMTVAENSGETIFFEFTTSRPPFNDERARKAIAYAIDSDEAIAVVFGDLVKRERCAVGPGVFGNDENWCKTVGLDHDPAKAKALLAELGYGPNKPMEVTLMTWPDDYREKIAQVFQNQLAEVGVNANLETMDIGTLNARVKQENEMSSGKGSFNMMGWEWFDPDILYALWHSPGAYSGFQTKDLDGILDKSRTTIDLNARQEVVRQAQQYLLSRAVQVPLYSPGWAWAYAVRNEVKGFKVGAFNLPAFNDVTVGN